MYSCGVESSWSMAGGYVVPLLCGIPSFSLMKLAMKLALFLHVRRVEDNCLHDAQRFISLFIILYMQVFCVVVGGTVFRFLKGSPPLKDQWGYAFTVATIAFHLFIITAYTQPEKWTLPILRFSMILLGFAMSTLVNIAIKPIYAGDTLHKLVAKNFETAAYVFQRYGFLKISSTVVQP